MRLDFITQKGEILPLTDNLRFNLLNIDGLTVANADIASTSIYGYDGDTINNMSVTPRSLVIELAINGTLSEVEKNKHYIMQYIKPKQIGTLRMQYENINVQLLGVVQSIDMPRFNSNVIMQITLYCSQPFWEDEENKSIQISERLDLFYWTNKDNDMLYFTEEGHAFSSYDLFRTQTINNTGDTDIGMIISIIANGTVDNPSIYNQFNEKMHINISMNIGDEIVINTIKKQKSITLNGVNIMNKLSRDSKWLQLYTGENNLTIDSDDGTEGNMYFIVSYKQRYV